MEKNLKIRMRIAEVLGRELDDVLEENSFSDLGVESFTLINMVIDLQEHFKVRLNQEDLVDVLKVGDLTSLVASRMK